MKLKILETNIDLNPEELSVIKETLMSLVGHQVSRSSPLTGRLPSARINLKNTPVHLKVSVLGGTVGKLAPFLKLSFAAKRVKREFFWLNVFNLAGLNVPKPFGYLILSCGLKRIGVLLTHFVEGQTMSSIFQENQISISSCINKLELEFIKLVSLPVIHLDFHPGNILVSSDGKVYLLDLASIRVARRSKLELLDFYFKRWRRACLKHKLPDESIHYFAEIIARLKNEQSIY